MGTVSNTLSSSGSGSTASSSTSPTYFTGVSTYSTQFQQVIGRAVSIASLPVELLTSQQTTLNNQAAEYTTLDGDFSAIQTAIQNISSALGGAGMTNTVSDPSVASVTVGDGAAQGFYSINVSNIGTYATSLTSGTWNGTANASAQPTMYNLVIGGTPYAFSPADNSATTVASTINAQFGSVVQATAVNVGSASNPDYRLSLQSNNLGPLNLQIQAPADASLQTAETATTGNATSQTTSTWDSSGTPSTYTLVVDGTNFALSPADNSATSVAAAINALSGNPVKATVVNLGTDASPDERIQLQSSSAATATVDIQNPSGSSLQQQQTPVAASAAVSQTSWTWDPTADPSGNPTQYTLTVGGTPQTFTSADNSAASVAAAINALSGNPVTATVVDAGTTSNPDYRIQLVDNTGTGISPQLSRATGFLVQNQGPAGALAQYQVSNSGVTVTSNTRQVSIAAGTTLSLTGAGVADITVTQSISTLNTALSGFADAYNAAVGELNKQYGQSGGPLQGQSIVYSLSHALSQMSTYYSSASGSVGLSDLGFTLNVNGTLTYSPLNMFATDLSNSAGVIAFLGSATGGGFLQAATNAMANVETPATGILKTAETSLQLQITDLSSNITKKQAAITALQTSLTNQLARSDAAIASMQQQFAYITSVFQAQQTADQMYANE